MKKLLLLPFILSVIFCNAQANYALSFDGVDDYVEIPDQNVIDLSASFTIEAWLYPTGPGSSGTDGGIIVNKENSYEIARFPDGSIRFAFSANGTGSDWSWNNTGQTAPLNQWTHIALVKSGTLVTLCLNSKPAYTNNVQPATLVANTETLRIGGRTGGSHYFNGYIEEVRIWNSSRTETEIKSYIFNKNLAGNSPGLVAYYKMNEGSGITSDNFSTNATGLTGTLMNGTLWIASPIKFAGNALNFDGVNDNVVLPNVISSDFTIEYWIRTSNTGAGTTGSQWYGGSGIVDAEVGGVTNDWGMSLTSTKLAFGIGNPDITLHSTSNINTGNWIHVAATWQQSTGAMRLYINGVQEASGTSGTAVRSAPPRITLGQIQTNINFLNFTIDELRIWNTVRTQTEIQNNKDNELDPAANANLTDYYTFNYGNTAGTNTGFTALYDSKGNNNGSLANFTLTGASSNFIAQNGGFFVLPLQWGDFTVQQQGENILLKWSTLQEQNCKDFTVQHSSNGINWENLHTFSAAGNSTSITGYHDKHVNPAKGMHYYRIRQSDFDNRISYSEIRSVNFNGITKSFMILSNPVHNNLLQVNTATAVSLSLFDINGRLLWAKSLTAGVHNLDLHEYNSGVYLLSNGEQTERVVLQ